MDMNQFNKITMVHHRYITPWHNSKFMRLYYYLWCDVPLQQTYTYRVFGEGNLTLGIDKSQGASKSVYIYAKP